MNLNVTTTVAILLLTTATLSLGIKGTLNHTNADIGWTQFESTSHTSAMIDTEHCEHTEPKKIYRSTLSLASRMLAKNITRLCALYQSYRGQSNARFRATKTMLYQHSSHYMGVIEDELAVYDKFQEMLSECGKAIEECLQRLKIRTMLTKKSLYFNKTPSTLFLKKDRSLDAYTKIINEHVPA